MGPRTRLTDRDRARMAILLNQLATPGLGSWWMGRRWAGVGQLLLALAGFAWVLAWFVALVGTAWQRLAEGEPLQLEDVRWPGLVRGLGLFGLAWLWAGWTSVQIWLGLGRRGRADSGPGASPIKAKQD